MGMFDISPEKQAEWQEKYKEAVQPYADGEEVLAVGPFQRTGQYLMTIPLIGQLMGLILYLVYSLSHKKRSAGLPSNYLLVVTPSKVRALKYAPRGYSVNVKHEVAVWDRPDLRIVSRQDGGMATVLTFEASENGEVETFKANTPKLGSNPFSAEVVELIQGGSSQPAAG